MKKENKQTRKIAKSAPESLKLLWEHGSFKTWKNFSQIVSLLAKGGYNFTASDLGVALIRAKYLTRRGKKGAYKYIQKHPFISDEKQKQ